MIVLQFATEAGLTSGLIRAFDHCPWSHVDTILPDGSLLGARSEVAAGIPAGVQIRPPGYAPFTATRRVELPAGDAMTAAYLAFLRAQLGAPYDMAAIAGFAVGRDWRSPAHWFCSELVAAGLEACGWFPWPLAVAVSRIDPGDLLLAVSARERLEAAA